jgi:hypothetical protein
MRRQQVYDPATEYTLREADARRIRPNESFGTLVLGTLALGLGVVTLSATLAGMFGKLLSPWTHVSTIEASVGKPNYVETYDPVTDRGSVEEVQKTATKEIVTPTAYTQSLSLLGCVLGLAGLAIAHRRRRMSWVCLSGFLLCSLCPCIGWGMLVLT